MRKLASIDPKPKRSMTPHVQSRWYRAPEVITCQKKYDQACDIWSLGCIFFELASSVDGLLDTSDSGPILFKGDHCYPLSPAETDQEDDSRDQLAVILAKVGKL